MAEADERGRPMKRLVVCLLAAAAVVVTPTAAEARPPGLNWHKCANDIPNVPVDEDVRCASLRLPVDWAAPHGATFDLAVAQRPARKKAERVGTLIFGPGGPGDSGVERIRKGDRFSTEILDKFDTVSFDPRTVARSSAPTCTAQPSAPLLLRDQRDFDDAIAGNRAYWDACRATSAVFDHADTVSTAKDLEALRRALGERKLTFHGSSYGTLLGQQYAELYPDRVRAIVLESVFDHGIGLTAFVRSQAATVQDSFDEFVKWCAAEEACVLHGQDVRAVWAGVLAQADRDGIGFETAMLPLVRLAGPDWPRLAQNIDDLAHGRPVPVGVPPLAVGAFCADWPAAVRDYPAYAELVRVAKAAGPDIRYGAGLLAVRTCLGWTEPVRNPPHRLHVRGSAPILLLNALHDPRTGYDWATDVAAQLGRQGRLVTYEGWGHGSYRSNDCTTAAVDRYLIDLRLPPRGATCPVQPS
jgi:pimeloyl-ACP methyl ester carboxylesterase